MTQPPRDRLLAETAWLAAHLQNPTVRVVDIRGIIRPPEEPKPWYLANREAYLCSHIPGAVYVDWLTDIVDTSAPVPMTVAAAEQIAALMERLGIGDEHTVVAYDDDGGHIAARLWWVLNYYGHGAARILNGGFPKWVAEGRAATPEIPRFPPTRFTPRVEKAWRATSAEVRSALHDPEVRLVDCRSVPEFRGEIGRGEKKGRIPGAANLPFRTLVEGEHKTFKSTNEIQKIFAEAGVSPDRKVITYCNAGVSASVDLFALTLAGYPRAANFAGSWYEWERDPTNPITRG